MEYHSAIKKNEIGLPRWLSGKKKSTCQCRGYGLDPWSRKIPHATKQLKPTSHNY